MCEFEKSGVLQKETVEAPFLGDLTNRRDVRDCLGSEV